jgi:hypothetical protein
MQALSEWTKRTLSMRDTEGRPLGEAKAPLERRAGVALELRTCPYADSRHNHARPMNVSALKQMTAHWEEALGGVALLRSLYRAEVRQEPMRLIDVWRVAGLTSAVADFAFLRAWEPVADGAMSLAGAVLYKVPLGISLTTSAMWADGALHFDAVVDADALYDYADRHGHFVGAHQVCAGPVAMVKEVLRLMIDGTGPQGDPAPTAALIGDRSRFLHFAHGAAALSLLGMVHARLDAGRGFDLADLLAADPQAPALAACVRRKFQVARYQGYDAGARLEVVDELFGHLADPRLCGAEVKAATEVIREAWARPRTDAGQVVERVLAASPRVRLLHAQTRAALGQGVARFCAVEQGVAALVRLLKGPIADALGVERTGPEARERHLVDYVPAGIGLTRSILSEAFGVEVEVQADTLRLACGSVSGEPL